MAGLPPWQHKSLCRLSDLAAAKAEDIFPRDKGRWVHECLPRDSTFMLPAETVRGVAIMKTMATIASKVLLASMASMASMASVQKCCTYGKRGTRGNYGEYDIRRASLDE